MSILFDKFFEEKDGKVFNAKSVLVDFNNQPYDLSNVKMAWSNPLELRGEDGTHIGAGNVYLEGKRLIAEILFDYNTPDRLNIETEQKIYLHANGWIEADNSQALRSFSPSEAVRVSEIQVWDLFLSKDPVKDANVEPAAQSLL